jgi:hypothetical protein
LVDLSKTVTNLRPEYPRKGRKGLRRRKRKELMGRLHGNCYRNEAAVSGGRRRRRRKQGKPAVM